ncbi:MAG: TIGR03756 family integrating conjugative element protein [Oleispira sp.]|nr:TIGR03756 family integrating conjugative element protein [Oleispira sp.]
MRPLTLILAMGLLSLPAQADITTAEILQSSLCIDCIDYQVIGMCIWMTCTPLGCNTDESIKIKHRIPDLVAMSYPNTGEAPWQATQWMSPSINASKGGGNSYHRSPSVMDTATVTFNNVDLIGHPAGPIFFEMLSSFGYSLTGAATVLMPYYLSSLDPLGWRHNIPDIFNIDNWNPMVDSLGNWGSVYPRGGFSVQPHPFKSAALAAFKAVHIVTRPNQSRVYQQLEADNRQGYWPPEPLSVGSDETAWQMLYPKLGTAANVWPDINDAHSVNDPFSPRISDNGEYVWAVWRTYRGCEQEGAMLIAHFGD